MSYGGTRIPPHNRKGACRKLSTYGCARRISTRRKRVSYWYAFGTTQRIRWVPADGSGEPEHILEGKYNRHPEAWSPDGKLLLFSEDHADTKMDLWTLDQNGVEKPLLTTRFDEQSARLSPNGRWLAYESNESGRFEVYVQRFPGPGGKWPISTGGGQVPVWARNGRELFYRNGDQMLAVAIQTEPSFVAGRPEVLFEGKYLNRFDVAPDGQRFLMVARPEPPPNRIHVVLNWTGELSELAPTN